VEEAVIGVEGEAPGDVQVELLALAVAAVYVLGHADLLDRVATVVRALESRAEEVVTLARLARRCLWTVDQGLWYGISAPRHFLSTLGLTAELSLLRTPSESKVNVALASSSGDEVVPSEAALISAASLDYKSASRFARRLAANRSVANAEVGRIVCSLSLRAKADDVSERLADVGLLTPERYLEFVPGKTVTVPDQWLEYRAVAANARAKYRDFKTLLYDERWRSVYMDDVTSDIRRGMALAAGERMAMFDARGRSLAPLLWTLGASLGDEQMTRTAACCVRRFVKELKHPALAGLLGETVRVIAVHSYWRPRMPAELVAIGRALSSGGQLVRGSVRAARCIANSVVFRLVHADVTTDGDVDEIVAALLLLSQESPRDAAVAVPALLDLCERAGRKSELHNAIDACIYSIAVQRRVDANNDAVFGAAYSWWAADRVALL
jgi:hypothetical protein